MSAQRGQSGALSAVRVPAPRTPRTWAVAAAAAVVLAVAAVLGTQWYLEHKTRERLDAAAADLPADAELRYDDVAVDLLGRRAHVYGVYFRPDGTAAPLQAREVVVHEYEEHQGRPVAVHLEALGLRRDLQGVETDRARTLRQLGYPALEGHFELAFRFDPERQTLRMPLLVVDFTDLGRLEAMVALDGVSGEAELSPTEQRDRLFSSQLVEARISFRDDSLLRRVIEREAEERGEPPEAVRKALQQMLAGRLDPQQPFQARLLEALARFIDNPGRLELSARPAEPVSVARVVSIALVDGRRLPGVLNLQVGAQ